MVTTILGWILPLLFFVAATNIAGFIAEFWIIIFQAKVDLGSIFAKKLKEPCKARRWSLHVCLDCANKKTAPRFNAEPRTGNT